MDVPIDLTRSVAELETLVNTEVTLPEPDPEQATESTPEEQR